MKRIALVALFMSLAGTGGAMAYSRFLWLVNGEAKEPHWVTFPIPIVVNLEAPSGILPGSQPFQAVRNAFEMRSAHSSIRFVTALGNAAESIGNDGVNLVTFADTVQNRDATAFFGAVTYFWFSINNGEPEIFESDIVFNPQLTKSTTGAGSIDIEALCHHELTHTVALEHPGVLAATAYPDQVVDFTKDTLTLDDMAGTEHLYPFGDTPQRTGALRGTVLQSGSDAVFGAQAVAVRQTDGAVFSDVSIFGGEWRIGALPPGGYTVYAEPFDGPYDPSIFHGGVYGSNPFQLIKTQFAGSNSSPTVFNLAPGQEITGIVITPPAGNPTLNPGLLGESPNGSIAILGQAAVEFYQGSTSYLTVGGPGLNLVPDNGVSVSGTGVNVSSSNVTNGSVSGVPYKIFRVTVDAGAPAVARSILVTDGANLAAITGGIDVLRSPARPGLMRNDELTQLGTSPGLATIFPLAPLGPDGFSGIGEGSLRATPGSDDDDDLYATEIHSGYLDPDEGVAGDVTRPLVFYKLTDPSLVLSLELTPSGRVRIIY